MTSARAAVLRNFFPAAAQCSGEVDDVALLERVRRGDAEAASALFARHQGPIYRYAAHMCGRDAADDVVQETFLAVLRRSGQYDATRGPVANYLLGIARHFVLKRLGAVYAAVAANGAEGARSAGDVEQPTVLDSLTRAETIEAVRAAIESLPPAYREVVVLCELQEMTYEAAAGVVQCPVGTIRSRLHRARALLVSRLSAAHASAGVRKSGP
jgi:RNA polymerase sigma-70 factor (ECF subfamily)